MGSCLSPCERPPHPPGSEGILEKGFFHNHGSHVGVFAAVFAIIALGALPGPSLSFFPHQGPPGDTLTVLDKALGVCMEGTRGDVVCKQQSTFTPAALPVVDRQPPPVSEQCFVPEVPTEGEEL